MKIIDSISIFLAVISIISCSGTSQKTHEFTNHTKKEVLGEWVLKPSSPINWEEENVMNRIKLLPNSKAMISFLNAKYVEGSWKWKDSSNWGDSDVPLIVKSDILISYKPSKNKDIVYRFKCIENNGQLLIDYGGNLFEKNK